MKNFLTWFPRILVIAFAILTAFFATDAFSSGGTIWQKLGDYLVHLVPTAITIGFLLVAWQNRMLGGLLFVLWGLVFTIYYRTHREVILFMMFSLPLLVAGFLFIFSQLYVVKRT